MISYAAVSLRGMGGMGGMGGVVRCAARIAQLGGCSSRRSSISLMTMSASSALSQPLLTPGEQPFQMLNDTGGPVG
jgi:hypothetical protein